MSFYGYMVETEGDNPRLWSFRLSDTANTIREYLKELMDDLKRRHASLYDQQSEKGLMEQTAKILFSDTAATAVASLSMQKWCPFQNPADLRQQFDDLLPNGETGMAFVSFLHDRDGMLFEEGRTGRDLI